MGMQITSGCMDYISPKLSSPSFQSSLPFSITIDPYRDDSNLTVTAQEIVQKPRAAIGKPKSTNNHSA